MIWDLQANAGAGFAVRPRRGRWLVRTFVTLGWVLVLGVTFALGYMLARYDAVQALAGVEALRAEAAMLSEEVARGRAERVRMERAHHIDREARRQAQKTLADLQRERLVLTKRLSYLQRLVREGERGVIEVKDLQVTRADEPGRYRFDLVLSQLVPQDEQTRGTARVKLVVTRDGEEETLPLTSLPGSSPATIAVDFEYFQTVTGTIVLPVGVRAERLIVDIEPKGEQLAPSSEVFLWPPAPGEVAFSPMPATSEMVAARPAAVE